MEGADPVAARSALEFARLARQDTAPLEERARVALRDAGEHALSVYAFAGAARLFREALALWPAEDPERPLLVFGLGKALFWAERAGLDELAEARPALLAAGDRAHAAQADVLLSRLALARGDRELAEEHAVGAVELLRDTPPSREQAEVLSNLAGFHAVWRQSKRALEVGSRALALAEELGLDEIKAYSLTSKGQARIVMGDLGGLDNLEQAVEIADGLSSTQLVRSCATLATALVLIGDLDRAWRVYERGRAAAARFGDAPGLHWLAAERLYEHYWRGDWNDAITAAEALLAEPDVGYGRYASMSVRAWIRLARGDVAGALEDSSGAVEFARQARDTAALCPALALTARVLAAADRGDEAGSFVDEALELATTPGVLPSFWTADLAEALLELGRAEILNGPASESTRWLDAARSLLAGRYADAAAEYAAIGAQPEEARAHLRAAAALAAAGQREAAERELELTQTFHREVGASAYVRAAEMLLAPA